MYIHTVALNIFAACNPNPKDEILLDCKYTIHGFIANVLMYYFPKSHQLIGSAMHCSRWPIIPIDFSSFGKFPLQNCYFTEQSPDNYKLNLINSMVNHYLSYPPNMHFLLPFSFFLIEIQLNNSLRLGPCVD